MLVWMKNKNEYYKKTLGVDVGSRKRKKIQEEKVATNVIFKDRFYFLADSEDISQAKVMVEKLLKAVNKTESVFISEEDLKNVSDESVVFYFGAGKGLADKFLFIKSFPSFFKISKDNNLKKELWTELKKYS